MTTPDVILAYPLIQFDATRLALPTMRFERVGEGTWWPGMLPVCVSTMTARLSVASTLTRFVFCGLN